MGMTGERPMPRALMRSTDEDLDAFHVFMANGRLYEVIGSAGRIESEWKRAIVENDLMVLDQLRSTRSGYVETSKLILNPALVSEIGFASTDAREAVREVSS